MESNLSPTCSIPSILDRSISSPFVQVFKGWKVVHAYDMTMGVEGTPVVGYLHILEKVGAIEWFIG